MSNGIKSFHHITGENPDDEEVKCKETDATYRTINPEFQIPFQDNICDDQIN